MWGVEFLRQVAEGREIKLQDSVVVIGGGNVAVYAGGDIAQAGGAVIHAIAAGRRSAASIDRTLSAV